MAMENRRSFVLPSTTTLPSSYDPIAVSGILQERSYNAQQSDVYDRSGGCVSKLTGSNFHDSYPPAILASQARFNKAPAPLRPRLVAAYDEKKFDVLWQRLWESDGFRKYRDGQEKGQRGSGGAQVWPINREAAFFRGCVAHEPMGRTKKQFYSSKSLGRNELIAAFINNWLDLKGDEQLRRKQVSSHIQVLKGYFKDNKYVLSFLQGDKKSESKHHAQKVIHSSRRQEYVRSMQTSRAEAGLPLPSNTLPSQGGRSQRSNTLQLTDFNMCLQNERKKTLHTFTRLQKGCGMPDINLDQRPNWPDLFPELADAHSETRLDCDIIFAEATLKLIDVTTECDLAVQSCVISQQSLPENYRLLCETRIVERGATKTIMNQDVIIEASEDFARWNVPFASSYWVQKFSKLKNALRVAARIPQLNTQTNDGNNPTTPNRASINKVYKDVRNDIESTTAIQQIFALPKSASAEDHAQKKRMLVLYWKFKQTSSSGSEEGTTQTRYLYPPRQDMEQQASPNVDTEASSQSLERYAAPPVDELNSASSVPLLDPSMYEFDAVTAMAALAEPSNTRSNTFGSQNHSYSHDGMAASTMSMSFGDSQYSSMSSLCEPDSTVVQSYYPSMDVKDSSQLDTQTYDQSFRFWSNQDSNGLQYHGIPQCEMDSSMSGFSHHQQYPQHHEHRISQSTMASEDYSHQSYEGSPFSDEIPTTAGLQQPASHPPMHARFHAATAQDHFGNQNQYSQYSYHRPRLDNGCSTSPITPISDMPTSYHPQQHRNSSIVTGLLPSVIEK